MRCLAVFFLVIAGSFSCTSQTITTFAGNGSLSFSGDGGPSTAAALNHAFGIATDTAGNVYIADYDNNRIRKVDVTTGIINTIAGTGDDSTFGDGGPAISAGVYQPTCVTADKFGNVYFSERSSYKIRKISPSGIVTLFAGSSWGYSGDGGPATAAQFKIIWEIHADRYGNIYVNDRGNNAVRKINTAGIITAVAGNGSGSGFSGDGGPATAAQFWAPVGIALDDTGNLYIGDYNNNRIRKVNTSGIITTIAGTGAFAFSGDGGPAISAELHKPCGIDVDRSGNIYIADQYNHRIRKINTAGIITTVAGNGAGTGLGYGSYSGDGGSPCVAGLSQPTYVRLDKWGNMYIDDNGNSRIRRIGNTTPYYTGSDWPVITLCQDSPADTISTLLTAADADTGQTLMWSTATAPMHGTAAGLAYTTATTGGSITPLGITFTPEAGFSGYDTMAIRVSDGNAADTLVLYIRALPLPAAGPITGADTLCITDTTTLAAPSTGTWSSSNITVASISATGLVSATTPGTTTIRHTTTNTCGADTAYHTITVLNATDCAALHVASASTDAAVSIYPNPATGGTFSIITSTSLMLPAMMRITDITGRAVIQTTITTAHTPLMIDTAGIYLVQVVSATETFTRKLIIK